MLEEFLRIPNRSPAFDPEWERRGEMERAVALLAGFARARPLPGLAVEVVRLPGRTPLLLCEVPGTAPGRCLLYGHMDKQPEMSGWREGLGPWTPVREGDRLYGRGGADDGYALLAALGALEALVAAGVPRPTCQVLIEACEESGSPDLPAYLAHLAPRWGAPDLVVCLDSGCGDYERLWTTTSLRGLVGGTLRVDVLTEGVHSGDAGGVVPSSFRLAVQALLRLEDPATGTLCDPAFHAEIPPARRAEAQAAARILGATVTRRFPFVAEGAPQAADPTAAILARTWEPALEVVGAAGLPEPGAAGNVLRPYTALKLSLRLPPTVDAARAAARLAERLCAPTTPPARIAFEPFEPCQGWEAPPPEPWLAHALEGASLRHFGAPPASQGEGGSIPFMAMLGQRFPGAQFVVTGVLGPGANAHGPNEFLHVPTARRLTACVAEVLAALAARPPRAGS